MGGSVGGSPRRFRNKGVKEYTKDAFRLAGIYAAASSLWILISDEALVLIAKDPQTMARFAMYKGWGFVILTATLLFLVLRRRLIQLNAAGLENTRLNLDLVRTLEQSNSELVQAYDATIEALSYALDLKDSETKWHSKRVTDLTILVAKSMGMGEESLVHMRRGALLHDIGKMGIPDSILLKPGPLNAEEMEVMRKHPLYAKQMLSRIEYLQPALDIPYAHHEKWDGSGYPRGLKGEEIPLSARIFAVVDVFDALTSDRPYRRAWPREKALAEIQAQKGRQFDPQVVDAFFAVGNLDAFSGAMDESFTPPDGN